MQLELDGWKRGFMFSACHLIPGHPKCGRLHGHTYTVNLKIDGEPDGSGMVLDFGRVKKVLRVILDKLDHKVLVPDNRPEFSIEENKEEGTMRIAIDEKYYIFPTEDIFLMDVDAPTAEHMSAWLLDRFIDALKPGANITEIAVGLDEGWGQGAWSSRKL